MRAKAREEALLRIITTTLMLLLAGATMQSGPISHSPTIAWTDTPEETLHWDGPPRGGFSVLGEMQYVGAARFTPAQDCSVKAVRFYQWEAAENGRAYVWGQGTQHRPGDQKGSEPYSGAGGMQWKRVEFDEPVVCSAGRDFWVGVKTVYYGQVHPLGVDAGPMELYRGGFIELNGTWYQLTEPPLYTNRNWNIRALVAMGDGIAEWTPGLAPGAGPRLPTVLRARDFVRLEGRMYDVHGREVADRRGSLPAGVYLVVPEAGPTRTVLLVR
jgi:hypothetical protein